MESTKKFVQNKTIFLSFTTPTTSAEINIPFAVDSIKFKAMADNGTASFGVLQSDLIQWETLGIVFRNENPNLTQSIEYHFQTPTKIHGNYNFVLRNLDKSLAEVVGTENLVFVAEFTRSDKN